MFAAQFICYLCCINLNLAVKVLENIGGHQFLVGSVI